ncbi:MAG: LCP family protein [Clostridia bacterium]|jgi:LCP family protein required for cell wall assembly|nr:LCP family protein [Clostridia bacterium]MCI1998953.1 LCP family protein [Clostridia bacterium]MCI2013703.1 LCP family protein [Clostridia bacterium]
MSRKNSKKRKRRSHIATFFKIVFSMVLIFIVFAGASIFAYTKIKKNDDSSGKNSDSISASNLNLLDSLTGKDMTLNLAVFGVDADQTRTDVIFVVHYDSKTKKVNLISVPRDTRVEITDEMYQYLKENGKYIPSGGICKINEVHSYAGKEKANYFAVKQLEDVLGIDIDNYILINFDAFSKIVDLVGGVDLYVPQDMYWNMTDTGDILINLKEGEQHLDGAQAEQLVRFRRYRNGDVDRVKVQQTFLKALADKVLSSDSLIKNMPEYIKTMYSDVKTDISLSDMIKYSNYLNKIDKDNITMDTIPGIGKYVGNVSYYIHDDAGTRALVRRRFYTNFKTDENGNISSKEMNIEISNGTDVSGLAAKNRDILENAGYTVSKISTYKGEQAENTRIIVYDEGMGKDLLQYFPDAEITVDSEKLDGDTDILIILGSSSDTDSNNE